MHPRKNEDGETGGKRNTTDTKEREGRERRREEPNMQCCCNPLDRVPNADDFVFFPNPQAARVHALQAAYRKQLAAYPRDDAPDAGQIRSLGLIDAADSEKDIHPPRLLPKYKDNLPKTN